MSVLSEPAQNAHQGPLKPRQRQAHRLGVKRRDVGWCRSSWQGRWLNLHVGAVLRVCYSLVMTCIAMITHRGRTWAAADSLLADGGGPVMQMAAPKVWSPAERIVVGACGDLAWVERLRAFAWPGRETDPRRAALELADGASEGAALIGWCGRLWYVSSDRECAQLSERAYAVGSGAPYALGALAVSQAGPARRVADAVRMAARYAPGEVGGRVVSVGPC